MMFELISGFISENIENIIIVFMKCLAMQDINDPLLALHAFSDFIKILL
ncbi:MAG: hypothetical protein IKN56_01530 [Clostridia bacterium]|nr:hypothetical protein [Clostridia bacterium]